MSRLIDADALIKKFQSDEEYFEKIGDTAFMFATIGAINDIKRTPTIDAVEVVRCKDCKHFRFNECEMWGEPAEGNNPTSEDGNDYCSWGERKDHE